MECNLSSWKKLTKDDVRNRTGDSAGLIPEVCAPRVDQFADLLDRNAYRRSLYGADIGCHRGVVGYLVHVE